jgi:predicted nucleotidyltransferase
MVSELLQRDPALAEIVRRLVAAHHPARLYLFGSKARGDDGPDSDYDILMVVDADAEPAYRRAQRAYATLAGVSTAVDIVVWTRDAFDERLHLKASLPATVVREGKLLYAA